MYTNPAQFLSIRTILHNTAGMLIPYLVILQTVMNQSERDLELSRIRPLIHATDTFRSAQERFHHQVLRPLLKLQNELLLIQFSEWLRGNKVILHNRPEGDQKQVIEHICKTNKRLRAELFGILIGAMTAEEYQLYLLHQRELNKRITAMWAKRLFDQVQRIYDL